MVAFLLPDVSTMWSHGEGLDGCGIFGNMKIFSYIYPLPYRADAGCNLLDSIFMTSIKKRINNSPELKDIWEMSTVPWDLVGARGRGAEHCSF